MVLFDEVVDLHGLLLTLGAHGRHLILQFGDLVLVLLFERMNVLLLLRELVLGLGAVCLEGLEAVLLEVRVENELTKQELGAAQIRLGLLDETSADLRIGDSFGAGGSLVEHGL